MFFSVQRFHINGVKCIGLVLPRNMKNISNESERLLLKNEITVHPILGRKAWF